MKLVFIILFSSLLSEAAFSSRPTPAFDSLMDELDLNNTAAMDSFRSRMIHVLNAEEISVYQLRMLLEVLFEMNVIRPSVYFEMVGQELRHLMSEMQAGKPQKNEEFIYIFKQRYPIAKSQKLRTTILKIPLHIFYLSVRPQKSNTREFRIRKKIPSVQNPKAVSASENRPEPRAHREFP